MRDDPEDLEDRRIRFQLNQIADKDEAYNYDSEVIYETSPNEDSLTMTTIIKTPDGEISGTFDFSRFDLDILSEMAGQTSRRTSFCLGSRRDSLDIPQNRSRRGSVNLLPGGVDPNHLISIMAANSSKPVSLGQPNIGPAPEIEISQY